MRHAKKGRKLNRTSSHRKALMRNLATALITHKKINTTLAKAKELRPYIEKLITRAKHSLLKEQQGKLPEGQTIDVHSRRVASTYLFGKGAVQELFDEIAQKVVDRPGGYARIIKTGQRRGDSASTAIIQLVDWFDVQDGAISLKKKKKVKPSAPKDAPVVAAVAPAVVEEAVVETPIVAEEVVVEETIAAEPEVVAAVIETPAEEIIPSDDKEEATIMKAEE
jgi:large subunit ribosomal protein L17